MADEEARPGKALRGALEAAALRVLGLHGPPGGAVLPASEVAGLRDELGCSDEDLLRQLVPLASRGSLPHISGFRVGAAALGSSGSVYLGFNMELPGLPYQYSIHAEQTAIFLAVDAREPCLRYIATNAPPCGHCRQFMQELYGKDQLEVIFPGRGGPTPLSELLPEPFGPEHLDFRERLLRSEDHVLSVAEPAASPRPPVDDTLLDMALRAAQRSYVPMGSPSGVALSTVDGLKAAGFPIESVAFNPGMTTAGPLQGALVKLTAVGARDWRRIDAAVLVERRDAGIQYAELVRHALGTIAPSAAFVRVYIN